MATYFSGSDGNIYVNDLIDPVEPVASILENDKR